ncbi:hypothetical protein PRZ48_009097 [Zasmidium cellare]|uniref:Uncharacterized protein n=1 Tax=Zasmidium cellare TaxID=395010 RepID=A0ABR0EI05_ZASCE|nr:hypothetical protein PRZ48_009097 [Zasmidium cellare]
MHIHHSLLALVGLHTILALSQGNYVNITVDGADDSGCGCAEGGDSTCGYPLNIPCDGKCYYVGKPGHPTDECYQYLSWGVQNGLTVDSVIGYPYDNCEDGGIDMTHACGNFAPNKGCRISCQAGSDGS